MNGYGRGGRNPYILNLIIRWRWVVSFLPWLLYLSKGEATPVSTE